MVIVALVVTALLSAIGLGVLSLTNTEASIAVNFRYSSELLYAAEAAAECAVSDLRRATSWSGVLSGASVSAFRDATLAPTLPSGERLDVTALTSAWQTASDAEARRGANNPRWRLFLYQPLSRMARTPNAAAYVVAWVADDGTEVDNDPLTDANGVVTVRAQAFGSGGLQRTVEVALARNEIGVSLVSWREIR